MNGDIRNSVMNGDWSVFIAIAAFLISVVHFVTRSMDKSLSIREHEADQTAISRDIKRIEDRIDRLEETRPTTGELKIVAEMVNKRLDELRKS
jgi:hypothetical protein